MAEVEEVAERYTEEEIDIIREEILEVVQKTCVKHGLKVKTKGTPKDADYGFDLSLKFDLMNAPRKIVQDWHSFCERNPYKLSPDLLVKDAIVENPNLSKRYKVNGHSYYLNAFKPRARKFPILATRANGDEEKFAVKDFFNSETYYIG